MRASIYGIVNAGQELVRVSTMEIPARESILKLEGNFFRVKEVIHDPRTTHGDWFLSVYLVLEPETLPQEILDWVK